MTSVCLYFGNLLKAEHGLDKGKDFFAFGTATLMWRLGVLGRLSGDTARTGDSNLPKWYSRPRGIMLSIQSVGKKEGEGTLLEWCVCLYKSQLDVMGYCSAVNGQTLTQPWEALFSLACLSGFCLPYGTVLLTIDIKKGLNIISTCHSGERHLALC